MCDKKNPYKAYRIIVILTLALCFSGCRKEQESDGPKGYSTTADLASKLQGYWLADLDGDPEVDGVLMQLNFTSGGKVTQTSWSTHREGDKMVYNEDSIDADWEIVPDYDGYASAGLEGDAIKLSSDDEVYFIVESIGTDALSISYACEEERVTLDFARTYSEVDTSTLTPPEVEDDILDENGASAPGAVHGDWMSRLPDETLICDMSIPGSHDAATCYVDDILKFAACCQNLSIKGQWLSGCRAYDLRVRSGAKDACLYHNFIPCNTTLTTVLGDILEMLRQYPDETAILIVKPEGNDAGIENMLACGVLSLLIEKICGLNVRLDEIDTPKTHSMSLKTIEKYMGDRIVMPRPDLTLGEARGKVIVVFRFDFDGTFVNESQTQVGYMDKWSGNSKMTVHTSDGEVETPCYVQDKYCQNDGEADSDWEARKMTAFEDTWKKSAEDDSHTWYFNAATGSHTESFSIPNYVKTAGSIYPYLESVVEHNPGRGIVLMDYLGRNQTVRISLTEVGIWVGEAMLIGWFPFFDTRAYINSMYVVSAKLSKNTYSVWGRDLCEAVFEKNFQ